MKKGVKRKADTTTPTTPLAGPSELSLSTPKPAKVPARRESTRQIKKPTRDLPEAPAPVSSGTVAAAYLDF